MAKYREVQDHVQNMALSAWRHRREGNLKLAGPSRSV
jgi:hypothetical protein